MKKIQEVFVLEGKNDTAKMKSLYHCDTIETGGSALSNKTLALIARAQQQRGVIIFTDPDASGERLRKIINEKIPHCKNAFLLKEDCSTAKKVGIEHANKEVIAQALTHLLTYQEGEKSLSREDFYDLGLQGGKDAKAKRQRLAETLHIGLANAKTCFKRLNMLKITRKECEKILEDRE